MKCHTQRAKQSAQWLVIASSLSLTMKKKSKSTGFIQLPICLCNRAFFSKCAQVCVRLCERMCFVKKYVCMQMCCISLISVHLIQCRGNVLHWTELTSSCLFFQISKTPISQLAFVANSSLGFVPTQCLRHDFLHNLHKNSWMKRAV